MAGVGCFVAAHGLDQMQAGLRTMGTGEHHETYSSIFQEIILGDFDELITFKDKLNNSLLFSDLKTTEEYVKTHYKLSSEGKGVEWEKYMDIYEV